MKKLVFLTVFLLVGLVSFSQAYYKNALIFDANAGVEIYNTSYSFQLKDINNNKFDTTKTDKAGNTNFNFGLEYGWHKHFGIGARIKINNYITGKDSITHVKPTANSNDIMAFINYHPLKMLPVLDLVLGTEFGYSALTYNSHSSDYSKTLPDVIITGKGFYGSVYVNPRFYIGRFGFNVKLYAPFVNYKNLTSNNPDLNNYYTIKKWKGDPSWGISAGIQFRFLKLASKAVNAVEKVIP